MECEECTFSSAIFGVCADGCHSNMLAQLERL